MTLENLFSPHAKSVLSVLFVFIILFGIYNTSSPFSSLPRHRKPRRYRATGSPACAGDDGEFCVTTVVFGWRWFLGDGGFWVMVNFGVMTVIFAVMRVLRVVLFGMVGVIFVTIAPTRRSRESGSPGTAVPLDHPPARVMTVNLEGR